MVDSFNRIYSSMSAVMGRSTSTVRQPGHPTGRGTGAAGPRGPGMGRGAGRKRSRGPGGMGPGRGVRNSLGRPYTQNINTAQQNSKGAPAKKAPEKKQKKKNQKKGKDTGKVKTTVTLKKTAPVHFITIPCEPNTTNRHKECHILCEIRPCTNNIVFAKFLSVWNLSVRFYERF